MPKPNISILGDSISTFSGYTPGVFYMKLYAAATGLASVEDTWWMQVIQGLGGQLLRNDSYPGTFVCDRGMLPACDTNRWAALSDGATKPDQILIYSGLNDVAAWVEQSTFGRDYYRMLKGLKTMYPEAEIWAATLCQPQEGPVGAIPFAELDLCPPLSLYNATIRQAAADAQCRLADLAGFDTTYATIDGVHPNAAGMKTLSNLWMRSIWEIRGCYNAHAYRPLDPVE